MLVGPPVGARERREIAWFNAGTGPTVKSLPRRVDDRWEMVSRSHHQCRRGFAAIYTVVMLIALCGIVSLAVDLGRVQLAKTELQTAADAAARAAAGGLGGGASQAITSAVDVAGANRCDGSAVALEPNADVELGTWNPETKTFTALSGPAQNSATAVRVTARRVAARGTAIPLVFAKVVGRANCDVKAVAIATTSLEASAPAFVGLDGITLEENGAVASYRSNLGLPGGSNLYNRGSLGSNGRIQLDNNAVVKGSAILGPAGSLVLGSGSSVSRGQVRLSSPLNYPAASAGNAATVNDNGRIGKTNKGKSPLSGKDFTLRNNETISIGAGTYYFTSLTLNNHSTLRFTGAATIYVAGAIRLENTAAIVAAGNTPANVKIRVIGAGTVGMGNDAIMTADVYAPGSALTMNNGATINGAGVFKRITAAQGAALHYDETLGIGGGPGTRTISLVR